MTALQFDRHRRLRQNGVLRAMVKETAIQKNDLIYPLFIADGHNIKNEIDSMPGMYQWSLDRLEEELEEVVRLGIPSVLLFGVPDDKDATGTSAYDHNGIVQKATRLIKKKYPSLIVIADTCLCEYTDHGHCGVIEDGEIVNDESLTLLSKTAVSQVEAGADIVAPSNMMDGFVAAIRRGLDEAGYQNTPIMSYTVKYASAFYGPFRDAAGSSPSFGDRKTYQMDPANRLEALREAESDVEEGADFLMVKPAMAYLDVIRELKDRFPLPLVTYNISGEYAMIKAAAQNGWIDERQVVTESLIAMKRAGADMIMTYFAKDMARWIDEENGVRQT